MRVYTDSPAADTAAVLGMIGADAENLRAVEVVSSGLEAVFLSLTGRRYRAEEADTVTAAPPPPSVDAKVIDVVAS